MLEARNFVEHNSAETMAEFQGLLLARDQEEKPELESNDSMLVGR